MSIRKTIIVFRKELLDLFRDKRTIITSIVVPIILYPLIMIGFNSLMLRQTAILQEQDVVVYIEDQADNDYSHTVIGGLTEADNIHIYHEEDDSVVLFNKKIVQAIVTINIQDESDFPYLDITITYNRVDENSQLAFSFVKEALRDLEEDLVVGRLHKLDISENILRAIDIKDDNIASESQTLGLILSKILPYFLILISISGSAVAAIDLVAGEKERGTLETLLVSAAQRIDLVMGKYLAVITIALLTVVLNLASIFFSFTHIMSQTAAEAVHMEIPIGNILLIFILMFPMIVFFSSLLLSLSTYSRNMKEGYSYMQPIMIVAMLFSLVSTLPAIQNNFLFTLIPVINVSLMTRDILTGNFDLYLFLSTLFSTIFLVALGILFSIKLFSKETVLFRTSEEGSMFRSKKEKNWALSSNFAILFFLAILMLFYYFGISWQAQDLESGLIKTLVLLVLIPPLIVIKLGKLNLKKVLRLNLTNPVNIPLALIMAVPLFILMSILTQVINLFFPIPGEYLEAMQEMLFFEGRSIWYLFFLIALLPGICEEVMFRGYFVKAFENKGMWNSIILSGILFGVLHLDIYRLIPVSILGIWMGYLVIKTNSIVIPIIAHTANNAIVLLLGAYGDKIPNVELFVKDDFLSWWLAFPAIIIFLLLLKVFNFINNHQISDDTVAEQHL